MRVVVDASVAVKWLLPDPAVEADVDRALAVLMAIKRSQITVLQPPHWLAEVAAVVSRLHPEIAERAVELLYAMELSVVDELEILSKACRLSARLNHHLFDTLYHAVALTYDAPLITADDHYYRKARHLGHLTRLRLFKLES